MSRRSRSGSQTGVQQNKYTEATMNICKFGLDEARKNIQGAEKGDRLSFEWRVIDEDDDGVVFVRWGGTIKNVYWANTETEALATTLVPIIGLGVEYDDSCPYLKARSQKFPPQAPGVEIRNVVVKRHGSFETATAKQPGIGANVGKNTAPQAKSSGAGPQRQATKDGPPTKKQRTEPPVIEDFIDVDDDNTEGNDAWDEEEMYEDHLGDTNQQHPQRATIVVKNHKRQTTRTLKGVMSGNALTTDDGKTFSLPPPPGWKIISSTIDDEDDEAPHPQNQGWDEDDDDSTQTIQAVINKFDKEGISGLKLALRDEYQVTPNTYADREVSRLVEWAKTNKKPNKAGRLLLIDIQVSFAKQSGLDIAQFRAKLMKAETGSTPFSQAMATMTPKNGGRGRGRGRGGSDYSFRGRGRGSGSNNSNKQCSHCGKQGHHSATCIAKNGAPHQRKPANPNIFPIPGCTLA